jgi:hypothetical protein
MKTEPRFPYETSEWGQSVEDRRHWYEGLERFGPEAVRVRVAQEPKTLDETTVLTSQLTPLIGFVWEWVKWHDDQKAAAEERRQDRMERTARRSTQAAIAAAVAAFLSAIGTGAQVYYAAQQPPPAQTSTPKPVP